VSKNKTNPRVFEALKLPAESFEKRKGGPYGSPFFLSQIRLNRANVCKS
jgi:hypothetical protein